MRPELESIYQTAPIGLAVLDTDLRFLRVNERMAEMNGLPIEAHLGRTVGELLPDLAEQSEALLKRVLDTGRPIRDLEVSGETPAWPGVVRIWREQITPLRDETGAITRLSIVAEEITDQRRAEEALRTSRQNLQLAMDAAGQAMWEWDVRNDHLRFSGNWEQVLGYDPADVANTREGWLSLVMAADRDRADACLDAFLHGRTPGYDCEYRMLHAGGGWAWITVQGKVVDQDAQSRPVRMIGVARDITTERRAREELQHLAQLLQLAFDAILVWTPEGGIEFWNHGAELQYGYAATDALGRHPNELLKTEFLVPEAVKDRALETAGLWRGELLHTTCDGRRITVNAVMQRVGNGVGRVLEITHDVSEAKAYEARLLEREQELIRSQQRLQVALDAGRMGVWDWAPGLPRAFWSPEIYKMLGMPENTAPETFKFLEMVHPEDRPRLDAEIARVLNTGGDYEAEFRVQRTDGEVRWLVSRGRVMHDAEGSRSRMVGVNFDITERKQIEQALQEVDARRTEFLAMLAHELRNPLAPITNAVHLLERGGENRERRDAALQILRRQTAHMTRLVDDLLEGSRITQGRIELRMENVLVATSVLQAVEAARPLARERHQTLKVKVPTDLDLVADPARLTQIISNLVTNAVKYTQEGGHVVVLVEKGRNDDVSIVVQDNGPGISSALQPHLFELFTQDRRTMDRSQGGLGIGLALVKRLAELHGGHVRHETPKSGTGSRFVVCLPRGGRRATERGQATTPRNAALPPLTMLVVDDNVDAAVTLASLLRMDGHCVEVAHDGEHALAVAAGLKPRVVLLDLGLPKIDGLEVARRLRADSQFKDVILLATSGYAQAADREATTQAGFDEHLAKPVELAKLYQAIEAHLA
jgi:PAS domain S-box-containing protein